MLLNFDDAFKQNQTKITQKSSKLNYKNILEKQKQIQFVVVP